MNFLAHVQLSHGRAGLIVGNLVADAYKGKKYEVLPMEIQHGVILHRRIDDFTDTNDQVKAMKKILSPYFGRYAGVALDVYLDHVLSIQWHQYNDQDLETSVKEIHEVLNQNLHHVSVESRLFLERLIRYEWLNSYRQKDDLAQIFNQMSRRFGLNELKNSVLPLEKHFYELTETFNGLYPLLVSKSKEYIGSVGL